ncbi:uncharacterized protein LACBIDRAFT_295096 [Laccaria bicolor S238N-H82]|uniref:Predicted protein n=1 Tax=Laccaria bicolor (strain S238N-H82 / ATCC MYA-4686) TaxID=486041 RepID=B0DMN9_LACBS|nr:uncharacterized protein LACBIDRAFT_295096 [Laccaria bicolor S238N-H82]EDR04320.1 predicted protein [Laccaria bicolor S238N-H82]|eukprot:XP_001885211.1 predicted protein [Laccaria bicolor S238N-H82]
MVLHTFSSADNYSAFVVSLNFVYTLAAITLSHKLSFTGVPQTFSKSPGLLHDDSWNNCVVRVKRVSVIGRTTEHHSGGLCIKAIALCLKIVPMVQPVQVLLRMVIILNGYPGNIPLGAPWNEVVKKRTRSPKSHPEAAVSGTLDVKGTNSESDGLWTLYEESLKGKFLKVGSLLRLTVAFRLFHCLLFAVLALPTTTTSVCNPKATVRRHLSGTLHCVPPNRFWPHRGIPERVLSIPLYIWQTSSRSVNSDVDMAWGANKIQSPPGLDASAHSVLCACYFVWCVGADMDSHRNNDSHTNAI